MNEKKQHVVMVSKNKGQPITITKTPNRNDPCRCGSGEKYKKCHYNYDYRVINGLEEA